MANEVTINIESSLAAMAFVVADQQQQIKELREALADAHKANMDYHKMLTDANCKVETLNAKMLTNQSEAEKTINELNEKLRNATDDFENMVRLRDELNNTLEQYKYNISNEYLKDFHWEPWPEGKECITIPFDNLREKDCFPYVFVMYELQEVDIPLSPTEEQYKVGSPWIHCYLMNVSGNARIASIYANCNMKPRLFALVYPKDLITANALSSFRLQQQADNEELEVNK